MLAAGLLALGAGGWTAYDYLRVDSCLDRGGSWHDDRGQCDFEVNYAG
jgi:hypothetical protein